MRNSTNETVVSETLGVAGNFAETIRGLMKGLKLREVPESNEAFAFRIPEWRDEIVRRQSLGVVD